MGKTYTGSDVAMLLPTKDRPQKVADLLESLTIQGVAPGRVIVIDGGESIEDTLARFADRLPVEYVACHPPGQIRQRNMGISMLDEATPLVCFLDDDLVFAPDALERMIDFWNSQEEMPAGVGFNITNAPPPRSSLWRKLLLMNGAEPGRVLVSGYATSINNLMAPARTQWLGGGYTIWRRDILLEYAQEPVNTSWAVGEDLRFSYPIGKQHPLFICAEAKVRHEHLYDQAPQDRVFEFKGRKRVLWSFHFVSSHPELSRAACLWMHGGRSVFNLLHGLLTRNTPMTRDAKGALRGVGMCIKSWLGRLDLQSAIEDDSW